MTEIILPPTPRIERVMRPPLKWTPDTVPVVVIEMQDVLGPQPDTGYVDLTGTPPGKYPCAECDRIVIVAHAAIRPGGERPIVLDAARHMRGPWRVYAKREAPSIYLATFDGVTSEHALYVNHRAICPTARITP